MPLISLVPSVNGKAIIFVTLSVHELNNHLLRKKKTILGTDPEDVFLLGVLPRYPLGNAENNIFKKILTVNKVMSFSGLFLLTILNVAQGHNSKIQYGKNNSGMKFQERHSVTDRNAIHLHIFLCLRFNLRRDFRFFRAIFSNVCSQLSVNSY